MRRHIFLLILALGGLAGCTDRVAMNQEQRVESLALPPTAENVELVNPPVGSWHTFDLPVEGGQKIHVLRHYTDGDSGTEAMVVIPRR